LKVLIERDKKNPVKPPPPSWGAEEKHTGGCWVTGLITIWVRLFSLSHHPDYVLVTMDGKVSNAERKVTGM
jgi:hypothetical protein